MGAPSNQPFGGQHPAQAGNPHIPPARTARRPLGRSAPISITYPTPWLAERARILAGICRQVDAKRAAGQSLRKALAWWVWYWRERCYKSAPKRKVRFSLGTLDRMFRRWVASGRSESAFALGYRFSHRTVPSAEVRAFIRANGQAGVKSMRGAFRAVMFAPELRTTSARVFIEHLPAKLRSELRKVHRARRELSRESQAIEQRRRALERRLRKLAEGIEE